MQPTGQSSTIANFASLTQTPSSIHFVHLPKRGRTCRLPQPASERAKAVQSESEPIILPPLHRNVLNKRGKNVPPHTALDPETTIQQVYLQGGRTVIDVPLKCIRRMPLDSAHVSQLILCPSYDPANPKACTKKRCRFVHADVDPELLGAAKGVHINYAWRTADTVTYERFPAGEVLHVAVPNSKVTTDVMDSQMALKTKALESSRRPLSHCAHYYYNRTCNLGADCQFIHAVFIDPSAGPNQRAPLPAQLGRGRDWVAATMSLVPEREAEENPATAAPATFIDPLVQVMAGGLKASIKFSEPPMAAGIQSSIESSLGTNATGCPPVVSSIEASLETPSATAGAGRRAAFPLSAGPKAGRRHVESSDPSDDEEEEVEEGYAASHRPVPLSWADMADDDGEHTSTHYDDSHRHHHHEDPLTATMMPERYRHNPYMM